MQKLDTRYPGYWLAIASALPPDEAARLARNFDKANGVSFPPASRVFPGLDAGLDTRLARVELDKDAAFCAELAAMPTAQQRDFLELYLVDPVDARHWATLPAWKRPIRRGDSSDQYIWKFFIQQRLNMEALARGQAIDLKAQGYQWKQMAGCLLYITDWRRFALVMSIFASMLHSGQDVGDVINPPWLAAPPPRPRRQKSP